MGDVIRLVICLWSAALVIVAGFIGYKQGHTVLYAGIAALTILGIYGIYIITALLVSVWRPPFPRCRTGRCAGVGYYHYVGSDGNLKRYRCECGIVYLLSQDGTLNVVEQEKVVPFMRHSRFSRWKLCKPME
jgi:hypothetical protein